MERTSLTEMSASEDVHWWFKGRRSILQKVLTSLLDAKKPQRSILDVGCGSGGNLEMLSALGQLSAMELDDEARDIANNRGLCEVQKGSLPGAIPFEAGFDLITMLDVLEHVEQDSATLHALYEKLSDNGKLLITVPAYKFLWSSHDVANHHWRRYTRGHLQTIVSEAGFEIQYATYFNTLLFPLIAALRLVSKCLPERSGTDVDVTPGFANRALLAIFSSERALLPAISMPFGVSILLVATKTKRP